MTGYDIFFWVSIAILGVAAIIYVAGYITVAISKDDDHPITIVIQLYGLWRSSYTS